MIFLQLKFCETGILQQLKQTNMKGNNHISDIGNYLRLDISPHVVYVSSLQKSFFMNQRIV